MVFGPGRFLEGFGRDETASKLWRWSLRWLAELREIILIWEFLRQEAVKKSAKMDPIRDYC
jgi:hypothetical protein